MASGGEEGIRTLEKLLTSTPLAGARLRPLGHLSAGRATPMPLGKQASFCWHALWSGYRSKGRRRLAVEAAGTCGQAIGIVGHASLVPEWHGALGPYAQAPGRLKPGQARSTMPCCGVRNTPAAVWRTARRKTALPGPNQPQFASHVLLRLLNSQGNVEGIPWT